MIRPGLIFVQKAFLVDLLSGELIFGGAYYWREFCVSKWVGLDNKNSLKHEDYNLKQLKQLTLTVYTCMGLYSRGIIIVRIFASEIWGTCLWEDLILEGLIIGILRYFTIEEFDTLKVLVKYLLRVSEPEIILLKKETQNNNAIKSILN